MIDRGLDRYSHPGNAKGRRGRPMAVAAIDFKGYLYSRIDFYNQFYKVCSPLTYREIMALSRVLQRTPRTVQNWKYEKTAPTEPMMRWVIRWAEIGRPLLLHHPGISGRPFYIADVEAVQRRQ